MISPITINDQQFLPEDIRYDDKGVWIGDTFEPSDNPRLQFARILGAFTDDSGLAPGPGSCFIRTNTILGKNVKMGTNCCIGGNGFGYEYTESCELIPMPHLGNVVIGDNVTLHSNVCIDRAVTGSTIIVDGTKIDNLVHVSHGVKIGKHCLIVAGVVLGGRCSIGDYSFIGMNVCIKQHVKIGKNCVIGAGAVVTKDVPDNQIWVGNPAKYFKDTEERRWRI